MKFDFVPTGVDTNAKQPVDNSFYIGNTAKIIAFLRNKIYSKPLQTCVQEYLSNARDAMRECGKADQAIIVTLPTRADTKISVRDFGPGLDPVRIKEVFMGYGNTTKDQDDSQTGGLGIGAKSAWAYTDSFMVISYLNGTMRTYVCHIGTTQAGSMDLLSETTTEEPNGTEIQIALKSVDDCEAFARAVYRASVFWDVQPTLKGVLAEEVPEWYFS